MRDEEEKIGRIPVGFKLITYKSKVWRSPTWATKQFVPTEGFKDSSDGLRVTVPSKGFTRSSFAVLSKFLSVTFKWFKLNLYQIK